MIRRRGIVSVLAIALLGIAPSTAGAAGALSPSTHDFGEQSVGTTSAPSNFTLTNFCILQDSVNPTFCAAYNPVDPAVTSTGDFAQTNDCPPSLVPFIFAVPATCTLTVTFTPTAAGLRTGTLTGASGLTSSLSGMGIAVPTGPTQPATEPATQPATQSGTQVDLKAAIKKCKRKFPKGKKRARCINKAKKLRY